MATTHPVGASGDGAGGNVPVLEIRDLQLGFGGNPLLLISSLSLRAGEVVAIVGASGSGKTTLLSCITGQVEPQAGTFLLEGRERGQGLRGTYVSRTLQSFPLLHWLTVSGNLQLAAKIRGVQRPDIDGILASFAATPLKHRYPASLSGGERCRASLSQALLGGPKLLLLDEPFTGLDTVVKQAVAQTVFQVSHAGGAAVAFVTHDLHDALEFSDRVVVIGSGSPATIVTEVASDSADAAAAVRAALVGQS